MDFRPNLAILHHEQFIYSVVCQDLIIAYFLKIKDYYKIKELTI